MFVVDLITAFLLAVLLTILFASIVKDRRYHNWRNLPSSVWLMALSSWATGIILVTSEAWIGHWVPFVLSATLLLVLVFRLIGRDSTFQPHSGTFDMPDNQGRMAIALYFSVTLLLLFCAISLRFYFENLG